MSAGAFESVFQAMADRQAKAPKVAADTDAPKRPVWTSRRPTLLALLRRKEMTSREIAVAAGWGCADTEAAVQCARRAGLVETARRPHGQRAATYRIRRVKVRH